jgi:hypothetical protein
VERVALCPLGPVTVALVAPADRFTLRVAVWPFGPVAVDRTLPPPRTVDLVPVFPLGPVTVDVLLTCAEAANVQRAINDTVTVRDTKFIISFPESGGLCAG